MEWQKQKVESEPCCSGDKLERCRRYRLLGFMTSSFGVCRVRGHSSGCANVRPDLRHAEFPESSQQGVKGTDEQDERREVDADDKRCRVVHCRSQGHQRRSAHSKQAEKCLRGFPRLCALYEELVCRPDAPMRYLLTYKLSQDHIELFFSAVRARGGFNNNPASMQFRNAVSGHSKKNGSERDRLNMSFR